jgi:glycosyltransferase involved in cell wall biosynthesis
MMGECMKSKKPSVSIIIPVYNGSNYLKQAIDSALSQTYKNIEIIVVNDGSKDDGATEKIALSYGEKIKYLKKENGGSSSALNTGIYNMTGEWFSWLSHDDLYTPEKVMSQVEYMNFLNLSYEEICNHIFFSASDIIDSNDKSIKKTKKKASIKKSEKINCFPSNAFLIAEPSKYYFHGCSCLVHKSVFAKIGLFNENLCLLNDYDMWFRVYSAGYKIHYLPQALVKGRIHKNQVSKSIGYSYHNSEQDMFWNRSLEWLLANHPKNEKLFFLFGKNAYLKTRGAEGDRAFEHIRSAHIRKYIVKTAYKIFASANHFAKTLYFKKIT